MEFYVSVLLGVPSMFIFPSLSLSFRFLFLYVERRRKKQNKNEWQKIHYLDERLKTGRSSLQASVFVHRVNIYPFLLGSFHVRLIYNLYRLSHSLYLSLFYLASKTNKSESQNILTIGRGQQIGFGRLVAVVGRSYAIRSFTSVRLQVVPLLNIGLSPLSVEDVNSSHRIERNGKRISQY